MTETNPKSAARLSAVQAYYSVLIDNKLANDLALNSAVEILKKENLKIKTNFAAALLEFATKEKESIDFIIKKYLEKNKPIEKINPLLLSVVSVALAELLYDSKTDRAIIISEYLHICSEFFGRDETGFVNAILDKFVKEVN
jgi:N utilization substance protein B